MAGVANHQNSTHILVSWLLVAAVLILRVPLIAVARLLSPVTPAWFDPALTIGPYLLTAVLIWWEWDALSQFHIDGLAVAVIVVFKPLQTVILVLLGVTDSPMALPHWPSLVVWAIALTLLIFLWRRRASFPRITSRALRWFAIGALAGIGTAVLLAYPTSFEVDTSLGTRYLTLPFILAQSVPAFLYQVGYAAVFEEPLFRGFLWGRLRGLGWREVWIWLFQAALFSLAHFYLLPRYPITFWILVPTGGLVLGLLAWRSRTIATSMAAHGFMNALGNVMGQVFAAWRA